MFVAAKTAVAEKDDNLAVHLACEVVGKLELIRRSI